MTGGVGQGGTCRRAIARVERIVDVHPLATFALLFCACFGVLAWSLLSQGAGLVWRDDGMLQQYPYFVLEGRWLRSLLTGGGVGEWSALIGYGGDEYLALAGNTLGNPINLLSVFATDQTAEAWLSATVPVTLFLSGAMLLRYCHYKGFCGTWSVTSALFYAFGAYSIVLFTQIYLLYPLVVAPVVLFGADRLFDARSPLVLVVGLSLACLESVNLGLMTCLALMVYCLVRYLNLTERKSVRGFLTWVGRFLACVAIALLVAGVTMLPVAASIASQGRLAIERPLDLLYAVRYYLNLVAGSLSAVSVGSECFFGLGAMGLCALVVLVLTPRRSDRRLGVGLAVLVAFVACLCLPLIGRLTNGMAYPNNRWIFALELALAAAVPVAMGVVERAGRRVRRRVATALGLYCIAYLACLVISGTFRLVAGGWWVAGIEAGLLALLAVGVASARCVETLRMLGLAVTVAGSCALFWYWGSSTAPLHVAAGQVASTYAADGTSAVVGLSDDETALSTSESYDAPHGMVRVNEPLVTGLRTPSLYNSMYNGFIDELHTSVGLVSSAINFQYWGLDGHAVLDALAGTRYFVTATGDSSRVPAQFDVLRARGVGTGRAYDVWETPRVLPVAYVAPVSMARSDYDGLSLVQREASLLEGVVLEDEGGPAADSSHDGTSVSPVSLAQGAGTGTAGAEVDLAGGRIVTYGRGQTVSLVATVPEGAEAHLVITGLSYDGTGTSGVNARDANLTVTVGGTALGVWNPLMQNDLYGAKKDWSVRLPNGTAGQVTVEVTFDQPGTYEFSSLDIETIDGDWITGRIDALSQQGADVAYGRDSLGILAHADEEGYLFLRIPYGSGWSATVDGEPVQVLRANVGFMAVRLGAGDHEVHLVYETPLLREGAACSVVGVAAAAALHARWRRRA